MDAALPVGLQSNPRHGLTETPVISFPARKVVFLGLGGSGTTAVTHVKAKELAEFGTVRPGIAFLAIDVMPEPPVVTTRTPDGASVSVTLELRRDYVAIGQDLDPRHLSHALRDGARGNDDLRWLLEQQPNRRFMQSVDKGTESLRSFGYLCFLWSQGAIEEAVAAVLTRLSDVRLRDSAGAVISVAATDWLMTGSDAGGLGSSVALPMAGLVKRVMTRLGLPVNRSFFTYLVLGAEAFPERPQRLSNACELLGELGVAQREGITP